MGETAGTGIDRVVCIADDGFAYPSGARILLYPARVPAIVGRVELDPRGTHRVVGCERVTTSNAALLHLTLQRVHATPRTGGS